MQSRIDVTSQLRDRGVSLIRSDDFILPDEVSSDLDALVTQCRSLPPDPMARRGERRRRYNRFVFHPWIGALIVCPGTTYSQDAALNPDVGNTPRTFAGLTRDQRCNRFLKEVISLDFSLLPLSEDERRKPWEVGVHLIQLLARPGAPGISSPDCLHKDGEPFTWIHLLERRNVRGGESVIADNSKRPILDVTLTRTLDTLVVRDEAVFHQVKRVEVLPGSDEGFRTALLVDFTPLLAQTIRPGAP